MEKRIEYIISSIMTFPLNMLSVYPDISDNEIEEVEKELGIILPKDFKIFYLKMNGFSIMGDSVYSISKSKKENLVSIFKREHEEVINPMPSNYLPFAPNGRGDHYCLDLNAMNVMGECPVIFWQWDYSFHFPDDIEVTHNCFLDWVEELIEDLKKF